MAEIDARNTHFNRNKTNISTGLVAYTLSEHMQSFMVTQETWPLVIQHSLYFITHKRFLRLKTPLVPGDEVQFMSHRKLAKARVVDFDHNGMCGYFHFDNVVFFATEINIV